MNRTPTTLASSLLSSAVSCGGRRLFLPGLLAAVLAVALGYHLTLNGDDGAADARDDLDADHVPASLARCTPADLERRDAAGATILMRAALLGNEPAVDALLARGADPNASGTAAGTALMMAAHMGHPRVVATLLRHGAAVDTLASTGASALTCAVLGGDASCVRQILAAGADPNAPGLLYPPLAVVATTGDRADLVRVLLDAGADPNARARDGSTVLQSVSGDGAAACVRALRQAGAR